uniref:Uncharacterized protein n=1 Tax=Timema bartmani TaxID=61472 RepID=A0A7R9ES86_9NEOP|nr:unnamed protein product [Timema bartmani]
MLTKSMNSLGTGVGATELVAEELNVLKLKACCCPIIGECGADVETGDTGGNLPKDVSIKLCLKLATEGSCTLTSEDKLPGATNILSLDWSARCDFSNEVLVMLSTPQVRRYAKYKTTPTNSISCLTCTHRKRPVWEEKHLDPLLGTIGVNKNPTLPSQRSSAQIGSSVGGSSRESDDAVIYCPPLAGLPVRRPSNAWVLDILFYGDVNIRFTRIGERFTLLLDWIAGDGADRSSKPSRGVLRGQAIVTGSKASTRKIECTPGNISALRAWSARTTSDMSLSSAAKLFLHIVTSSSYNDVEAFGICQRGGWKRVVLSCIELPTFVHSFTRDGAVKSSERSPLTGRQKLDTARIPRVLTDSATSEQLPISVRIKPRGRIRPPARIEDAPLKQQLVNKARGVVNLKARGKRRWYRLAWFACYGKDPSLTALPLVSWLVTSAAQVGGYCQVMVRQTQEFDYKNHPFPQSG